MGALDAAVRAGKALYAGISNYTPRRPSEAAAILRDLGTPLLIHQPSYSMFNRWIEDDGLLDDAGGASARAASRSRPLAQGLLTDRYLRGIPADSRVRTSVFLNESDLGEETTGDHPGARRDRPRGAGRSWPSSPWPGRCATRG